MKLLWHDEVDFSFCYNNSDLNMAIQTCNVYGWVNRVALVMTNIGNNAAATRPLVFAWYPSVKAAKKVCQIMEDHKIRSPNETMYNMP